MTQTLTLSQRASARIEVQSITPSIGARVLGVDISRTRPEDIETIRAALLRHKVIFLPGQETDAESFLAFAEQFGSTTLHHPIAPAEENKVSDGASLKAKANVWERDNSYRSDHWHTDVTFIDRPVSISMLRCITCPAEGGDTLFANTVTAYERLPEPLRKLADSLRAIHSAGPHLRMAMKWESPAMHGFVTEHPMVRVHSETGERSLMVGSFVEQILGLTREASTGLVKIFQDYILMPENVVRWRWTEGDLAMWDNRATQHYAVNDYGDAARVMQRLTVAGGIPVGVDGRQSIAIRGDASSFSSIGRA